jgi:F-type H+-transporting ATPase subunit a
VLGVLALQLHTDILAEFNPLQPVQSVPVFTVSLGQLHMAFSNHMLMVSVAAVFLLIAVPLASKPRIMIPRGLQNVVEVICLFLREEVAEPILHEYTDRFIGFVWTIFFFILSLNLLAMVPFEKIVTLLTGKENHLGGPATANIWVTGALATVTFFVTHTCGIKSQGFRRYFVDLVPRGPWWIMPILVISEITTMFIRPLTLAIRLFANIVSSHILMATFVGLILIFKNYGVAATSIFAVVALSFLDLLVAFIQAFIFTLLSALYISFALLPEHQEN